MVRSDTYSTLSFPKPLLILLGLSIVLRLVAAFLPPLPFAPFKELQDFVQWRSPAEGAKLAFLKNKAALILFETDNAKQSKTLVTNCFSNEDLAVAINDECIPIKVVDRKDLGHASQKIGMMEKQFMQDSVFPQLVLVAPDQLEGTITVKSFPHLSGDFNKESIYKLLELASIEHDTSFDEGTVTWSSPFIPHPPGKTICYFFFKYGNSRCTTLCNEMFNDPETVAYMNKNFTNYLHTNGGESRTWVVTKKLEKDYKIDFYPTVIVFDPVTQRSAYQIGYSGIKPTLEFLQRSYKELSAKH